MEVGRYVKGFGQFAWAVFSSDLPIYSEGNVDFGEGEERFILLQVEQVAKGELGVKVGEIDAESAARLFEVHQFAAPQDVQGR